MESKLRKIGIVSEFFYPHLGGVTEHVYFSAKELSKRGYETVILTGSKGKSPEVSLPSGIRVIRIGKSMPTYMNGSIGKISVGFKIGDRIQEVLEKEKFDLLHLHNPLDPILPLLFLKYSKTINIGTFHTVLKNPMVFKIFKLFAQKYLNKLNGVIAVSQSCANLMEQFFSNRFNILPNGVDTEWFANPKGKIQKFSDGQHNILFLNRLDPRNGLDNLIEAFRHIVNEMPDSRLIVVGDGPLRPFYERKAGDLINKKIFFEGAVVDARPEYFASSSVYVYPATIASFGIGLLEGMASGTPVVGTDNEGFRTIIKNGENGILVPQANPEALAQGIISLIKNPSLAEKIKNNGRETAEKFSWHRVVDQVLNFYDSIYLKEKGVAFAA